MKTALKINLSITLISVLLYWGYMIHDSYSYHFYALEWAPVAVPIGMPQDDAIAILEEKAWYYQPCGDGTDLFFYDSHDYDKTTILIMMSKIKGEEYQVRQLSTFEAYMWQLCYGDCIDRSRFD